MDEKIKAGVYECCPRCYFPASETERICVGCGFPLGIFTIEELSIIEGRRESGYRYGLDLKAINPEVDI